MRRGSFFDEFGSIISYTLIALMVVVLFFVCFAFSRKAAAPVSAPESSAGSEQEPGSSAADPSASGEEDETGTANGETQSEGETEPTPADETGADPSELETVTAEDGTVFTAVEETVYALDNVNLRTAPSTDGTVLAILNRGTSVTRTGVSESGWSQVIYEDSVVYVSSEFVGTTAP
jgi:uncharacterized protein YgiM (DUF1202 family)